MTDTNKNLLLQSIKTIRLLKEKLAVYEQRECADIAIVGISCRFPGAEQGIDAYWELLHSGRSGVAEVKRWNNQQFVDSDYKATGKLVTPYAGMLENIYDFDAEFFGLSAIEAENLDPQQRLLLEQSWLALEDAGIDIAPLRGSQTGVFVGIGSQDYGMALLADVDHANAYVASGNSLSMAAGRLSYFFDFNGPSLSIDTACSSSLVAVHEACRKLQQGDCQLALAAGVNAILSPHASIQFSRARMLTTERDCHAFDARAKGYVRGEGCGVLVLKKLASALADGDRIHAVIKGVAINHDGHSSGLTVPNGLAQEAVIRAALKCAGVAPGDVDYVEAHGTGTSLGDPIEARALAAVYAQGRDATHPLQVGAVKANLGHLEAAAGIAGLIKAVMVIKRGEVPPQPNFGQINPKIVWDNALFSIPRQHYLLRRQTNRPLYAGVSSFGFSGTNAHIILASPPSVPVGVTDNVTNEMTSPRRQSVNVLLGCFQRKRFKSPCVDVLLRAPNKEHKRIHPLVLNKLAQPDGRVTFPLDMSTPWLDFIDEHRLQGRRLLPASLLLELMRSVASDALGSEQLLSAVVFQHPVDIDIAKRDYLIVVETQSVKEKVSLWSQSAEGSWIRHVSATYTVENSQLLDVVGTDQAIFTDWQELDMANLYAAHQKGGIELGENFRCVRRLKVSGSALEGEISLSQDVLLDPLQRMAVLLDGCFQVSAGASDAFDGIHLLAAIGEMAVVSHLPSELRVRLARKDCVDGYCFDIHLTDLSGRVLGRFCNVFFKRLSEIPVQLPTASASLYVQRWVQAQWPQPNATATVPQLPMLTELLRRAEPSTVWAERFGLDDYNAYRQRVEGACLCIIAHVLKQLSSREMNGELDAIQAAAQCGIVPAQHKLFAHLISVLARTKPVEDLDFKTLLESYPRFRAETLFMQRCTEALPEVLQGRHDPLDVLFHGAASEGSAIEAIYVNSPISRVLNEQLAQLTALLGTDRPLRILEIGAGTGGTSRSVLEALRGVAVETYCYTDISPLFLERARSLFDQYKFVEYRRLDIEQPIDEQYFEPGSFDIVIATNVLHATRSISQTLQHVRELLAPSGYLLLRECIKPQLSADLSFGMTEGWWRFKDHDDELRPDYAILSQQQWEQQLDLHGFPAVRTLQPHLLSAEALIVAQAGASEHSERWLIVHDGSGQALCDLLRQQGVTYLEQSWCTASEAESRPDDMTCGMFDYLVCFPDTGSLSETDPVGAALQLSESMIAFCRSWLGSNVARAARLWCVTTEAERVNASDRLDGLAQSVLTGVLKCAALEFPGRIGGAIDLQEDCGEPMQMMTQVITHIRQPNSLRYLAIRNSQPFVLQLQPLERAQPFAEPAVGGAVLITGGLGGIGFALAQVLVAHATTLVLVSRHVDGEIQQARLQALQEQEDGKGPRARVIALQADLADESQVAGLFKRLQADGLQIDHIVHAAGVGGDQLLVDCEQGDLRNVVTVKVAGTWYLHRHAPRELKSFVVLSTMVSLWGAKQKTHYVLANHFADRVVQWRHARGLAAAVLQLGPVDSGMLDAAGKADALRVGVRSIDVQKVAALLAGMLSESLPLESALLDIDWARFTSIYRFSWLNTLFEKVGTEDVVAPGKQRSTSADFRRRYEALPLTQRDSFLDEQVFALLREILGLGHAAQNYTDTGFHDLGMDSLLTMSFAEKLFALTGVAVSSSDIFDNANLARLRVWLSARLNVQPSQASVDATTSTISTAEIEQELQAMQALLEER